MDLKPYALIFVKGRTCLGRINRQVTDSPYSHVAVVLDEWHVAETNWWSPLKVRHLTYPQDMIDVYRYREPVTPAQAAAMDDFIQAKLWTPYDFIQSITNGLYLLTGLAIRDTPDRMNCSEFADELYAAAGIDLSLRPLGKVTPADLARSDKLERVANRENRRRYLSQHSRETFFLRSCHGFVCYQTPS
ncbi:hypothetical protein LOK74_18940 [Brevibacillus humidisoli]|uniref:hypothetical protein n=1 Tax=Brevibacillus humidisoli TaxID=2895522 RepID=UPI001E5ED5A1|nr:hypothetical protein [Brevibacillus humidisoli]UFJ40090.1 hypothetical protein LOK74_18940 [Brevibacillus humidisoli]